MAIRALFRTAYSIVLIGFSVACTPQPKTSLGLYKVDADATAGGPRTGSFANQSGRRVYVHTPPIIDEVCIAKMDPQISSHSNEPVLIMKLKKKCVETLAAFTRENIGQQMALVIDSTLITTPTITSEIPEGYLEMTGEFSTLAEAQYLARIF